ncbi:MAG: hypothetical protein OXE46_15120 [Chloroflexi bacterium]|nr:hypothetical protein [Chloroflexota bacterium]
MGLAVGGLAVGLLLGAVVCLAVVAALDDSRSIRSARRGAVPEQVFQLGIDHEYIIERLDEMQRDIDTIKQASAGDTITLAEYWGEPRHDD